MNGGREDRQIGAYELAIAVEELGAGEIMLNCIDCDGKHNSCFSGTMKTVARKLDMILVQSCKISKSKFEVPVQGFVKLLICQSL